MSLKYKPFAPLVEKIIKDGKSLEIKVENDIAYIMEVGARLGGDFISTELTHLSTGVDMVAAAVDVALGIAPNLKSKKKAQGACIRYFCPRPGRLASISGLEYMNDEHVYMSEFHCKPGDEISEVKSSLDRSGYVIVTARNSHEAIEIAENLIDKINFEIV